MAKTVTQGAMMLPGASRAWDNRQECRTGPKRRYNGWTRRVTWWDIGGGKVRLRFEDSDGTSNRTYQDSIDAESMFQAFKAGRYTTEMIRENRKPLT